LVSGYPLAIGSGFVLVFALLTYSYVAELRKLIKKYSVAFQQDIDKADIAVKSEDFLMILAAVGALIWIGTIFLYRLPLVEQLATLPLDISITAVLGVFYLRFRGAQRIKGFGDQFEMALRMMSGALRVGLGFRQAIILVTEEVPNPARRELLRVIGRANIGINILDALDELSRSIPSSETLMFARVVRVQQQTGGDLAKVLEKLAITIRDRRRVVRKMNALTSQGRMGAMIIGGLPVLVGGFVMLTQPDMKEAMLHTVPGWCMLALAVFLEAMAAFVLSKILVLDA
jgi:tight adherence protein B